MKILFVGLPGACDRGLIHLRDDTTSRSGIWREAERLSGINDDTGCSNKSGSRRCHRTALVRFRCLEFCSRYSRLPPPQWRVIAHVIHIFQPSPYKHPTVFSYLEHSAVRAWRFDSYDQIDWMWYYQRAIPLRFCRFLVDYRHWR